MTFQRLAGLLLVTSVLGITTPWPASGQSSQSAPSESDEATDNMARERTQPFCNYLAEQQQAGKSIPPGDLSFTGTGGHPWVYKAAEVQRLTKRCERLMKLMQQAR